MYTHTYIHVICMYICLFPHADDLGDLQPHGHLLRVPILNNNNNSYNML